MSDNRRVIHAEPTKELFIYMLVRDIPLIRAIVDLVDNSVDGATRLQSNENYEGLWIKIFANKQLFKIEDNCDGITVKEAEEYAFKFGRANDAEATPKSIGRFGIGMKRAFFKIGNKFTVESTTSNSKFILCNFSKHFNATKSDNPYEIEVPNLTLKEIQYLDSQMLTDDCDAVNRICIPLKDVKRYAELYKYFPSFVEMFM